MCRVSTQKEDEKVTKEDTLGWVTRGHHFKGSAGTFLLVKAGKTEESEKHMLKDMRNSIVLQKTRNDLVLWEHK